MENTTFKQAYGVLQQHAKTLRTQQEPNIDDLLTIVTESVAAYKNCRARIDAVEKALEKALSDTGAPPSVVARVVKADEPFSDSQFDADDIPF